MDNTLQQIIQELITVVREKQELAVENQNLKTALIAMKEEKKNGS